MHRLLSVKEQISLNKREIQFRFSAKSTMIWIFSNRNNSSRILMVQCWWAHHRKVMVLMRIQINISHRSRIILLKMKPLIDRSGCTKKQMKHMSSRDRMFIVMLNKISSNSISNNNSNNSNNLNRLGILIDSKILIRSLWEVNSLKCSQQLRRRTTDSNCLNKTKD